MGDGALVAAIARGDEALLTTFADRPAATSVPNTSTGEDWLAQMRAQDEALAQAINSRDVAVVAASRS